MGGRKYSTVRRVDFGALNQALLNAADHLVPEWLPDGEGRGREWAARNPVRHDKTIGSFSVNLDSGAWGDFATDDRGGDLVSLYAYLQGMEQAEAGRELSERMGVALVEVADDSGARRASGSVGLPPPTETRPVRRERIGSEVGSPPVNGAASRESRAPRKPDAGSTPPKEVPQVLPPKKAAAWVPIVPVPADAPEAPAAHHYRGLPDNRWTYRDVDGQLLGYVCRFTKSCGGKDIAPLVYAADPDGKREWRWQQWSVPRPLYGLDRLAALPGATVMLVEGEKCADAAVEAFPDRPCLSWSGGASARDKSHWAALAGYRVILWADADSQREKSPKDDPDRLMPLLPWDMQPGMKAMLAIAKTLIELGCDVRLVRLPEPGTLPDGWDVADALWRDGWDAKRVRQFVSDNLVTLAELTGVAAALPAPEPSPPVEAFPPLPPACAGEGEFSPPALADDGVGEDWEDELIRNEKGALQGVLFNAFLILTHDPAWMGCLAWDEFTLKIVKLRPPPYSGGVVGHWTDLDTAKTLMWLQKRWYMPLRDPKVIDSAVRSAARESPFHPVRAYLESLPAWDGYPRVASMLADMIGSTEPYADFASQAFMVAAVKRIFEPGCKVDEMLVIEGDQGLGKSTFVQDLFSTPWYLETAEDPKGKEFYILLEGRWGVEIGELSSFRKAADWSQVKMAISRRNDIYRAPYDRHAESHPRQCVFVGTVNEDEWNADPTGGRRFIPTRIRQQYDAAYMAANRDKLWAEAMVLYRAGFKHWDYPKALLEVEQAARLILDPWLGPILDYLDGKLDRERYRHRPLHDGPLVTTTTDELLMRALMFDVSRIQRDHQTRVGNIMRVLKWRKRRMSGPGGVRPWVYERPEPSNLSNASPTPTRCLETA